MTKTLLYRLRQAKQSLEVESSLLEQVRKANSENLIAYSL